MTSYRSKGLTAIAHIEQNIFAMGAGAVDSLTDPAAVVFTSEAVPGTLTTRRVNPS
jgi:hypothetical protein